ncbi:hypothetical protein [Mesomycoplasma neurolyticum]|uniref:Lipoprotein n=1 Tax=Mesomycoplasma neurolyticum TaxID=2120 RepID=A0A449A4W8_9BACT|nr:hypothetical protein [Mesomycoplasma neurolyticum]VEU59213.1 Uncharacterised protein [Mesomycoplasma neurolyticum]
MKKIKNIFFKNKILFLLTPAFVATPILLASCQNNKKDTPKLETQSQKLFEDKKSKYNDELKDYFLNNIDKKNDFDKIVNLNDLEKFIIDLNFDKSIDNLSKQRIIFDKNLNSINFFNVDFSEKIKSYNLILKEINNEKNQKKIIDDLKTKHIKNITLEKYPEINKAINSDDFLQELMKINDGEQFSSILNSKIDLLLKNKYKTLDDYKENLKLQAEQNELDKNELLRVINKANSFHDLLNIEKMMDSLLKQSIKDLETIENNLKTMSDVEKKNQNSLLKVIKIYLKTINYYENNFLDFEKRVKLANTNDQFTQMFKEIHKLSLNYKPVLEILKTENGENYYSSKIYNNKINFFITSQLSEYDEEKEDGIVIVKNIDEPNTSLLESAFYKFTPPALVRTFELTPEDKKIQSKILDLRQNFIKNAFNKSVGKDLKFYFNDTSLQYYQLDNNPDLSEMQKLILQRGLLQQGLNQLVLTRYLWTIDYVLANGWFYEEIYHKLIGYNENYESDLETQAINYRVISEKFNFKNLLDFKK